MSDNYKWCTRIYNHRGVSLLIFFLSFYSSSFAQVPPPAETPRVYPRTSAYLGVLHPLISVGSQGVSYPNFKDAYIVGFPIGFNLHKTNKIGFSVELVPTIRSTRADSRVTNLLIHPGVLVSLGHDFTFVGRLAFETSGRYGFTPVLNKVIRKGKVNNYFLALPLPVRFGNGHPASVTAGIQFGIAF